MTFRPCSVAVKWTNVQLEGPAYGSTQVRITYLYGKRQKFRGTARYTIGL